MLLQQLLTWPLSLINMPSMERERLKLNQRLNHSFIMEDMEEATMEDIEDTMVDTEATMERERLRLNHSFIMEDMEEDTMEVTEATMVDTEATMERERLKLIPNMFMDIILVTAPLDMDIVATHPIPMDTLDKH